jgi:hypothetical protein
MRVRKLIYELMVVSPLLLLASIAIQARTFVDDFEFEAYDAETQRHLTALVEPLNLAYSVRQAQGPEERIEARRVAQRWIELAEEGSIRPLPPQYVADTMISGVRHQIVRSQARLVEVLAAHSAQAQSEGKPLEAAEDLSLAFRITGLMKYSDLASAGFWATSQRRLVGRAMELAQEEPAVRDALAGALLAVRDEQEPLDGLVVIRRKQYGEISRSVGHESFREADINNLLAVNHLLSMPSDDDVIEEAIKRARESSRRVMVPQLLSEIQLAWSAERTLRRDLDRALATLKQ